ncbi:MAG: hypothetical protein A2284_02295 [Deltaproteobacteria bacterium RIFOXYA12_FULL_61_11]|nr:MAG: hypothetical protein A2284_02295 [Deltaproteobacteria bacterium RIFOXYA12_FULL_61_11]
MSCSHLVIVIPTYNEATTILPLVAALETYCPGASLLVVDDASPDGTGDLIESLAQRSPQVHLLRRKGKLGLGSAYVIGFTWALEQGYTLIAQMDADFSHDPADLPRLLEAINHCDTAIGSRYCPGGETRNWNLGRRLISRSGSLYGTLFFPSIGLRDLTSGFKVHRREVLEGIGLHRLRSNGYAFQIELSIRARQGGFRLREIPITFHDRRVGMSKMDHSIVAEAVLRIPWLRFTSHEFPKRRRNSA